jgi:hypothetical protein
MLNEHEKAKERAMTIEEIVDEFAKENHDTIE